MTIINNVEILDANGKSLNECVSNFVNKNSPNIKSYNEPGVKDLLKFEIPMSNLEIVEQLKIENYNDFFLNRAISLAILVTLKATKNFHIPKNTTIIGVTLHTPIEITYGIYENYHKNKKIKPSLGVNSMSSSICSTLSKQLKTNGPNFMINQSCTSFISALETGKNLLDLNKTDMVIITGVDCTANPIDAFIFKSLGIHDNKITKPFSKDRNGINLGEGAVCFVLTNEKNCQNKIAKLEKICFFTDHYTMTGPDPNATSSKNLLRQISNNYDYIIDSINCHATGTLLGDKVELLGLDDIPYDCDIYGLKGSLGHTMSCSSGIEMAYSIYGLNNSWIPYTNSSNIENSKHNIVTDLPKFKNINNFVKLSFGFGGSSAAALISKV
jgi:3-oxoacyl-[acyl-carrier-protein] synthase-1